MKRLLYRVVVLELTLDSSAAPIRHARAFRRKVSVEFEKLAALMKTQATAQA
jgi:hypothetical protein